MAIHKFRRRYRQSSRTELPEVCLTPLIDTALTLLVIFMVTTPMIQNSLKIDLPEGNVNEAGTTPQQRELVITIDKQEKIYVNSMPTTLTALAKLVDTQLTQISPGGKKRVWISVDKDQSCSAGTLITVIDTLKGLKGVQDVAIATKRPSAATTTA
jgi:biopolymer transport protein ExbD